MGKRTLNSKNRKQKDTPWKLLEFLDSKANWFAVLLIGVSLLQSKVTIDPNIAIRFIGLSVFLAVYTLYFFFLKREVFLARLPLNARLVFFGLAGYIIWSGFGLYSATNPIESVYYLTKNALEILLMYIAFLAASDSNFQWKNLIKSMLWLGLLHTAIGLDQLLGIDITSFSVPDNPVGTMVNRNLFGSFLVLLLPFGLGYLFIKKSWNFLGLITIILLLAMIYFSQTRSAWIAALIIMGFFGLSMILKSVSPKWYFATLSLMGILLVGALLSYNYFVQENYQFDSLKDVEPGSSSQKMESANERLVTWQETLLMTQESPIMGVGLGNWKIEIPRFNQGGTRIEYGEITRIRPHNIYLHTLSETGIFGFLLLYGPILFIFLKTLTILSNTTRDTQYIVVLIFFSLVAGIISDGMFSFPTERISHAIFLFISLGFLLAFISKSQNESKKKYQQFIPLTAVAVTLWGIFLGYQKYKFESHMNRARAYYLKNRPKEALHHVKEGTNKWVTLEINNDPIELVGAIILRKEKKYQQAFSLANSSLVHNPYSSRILYTKGSILSDQKRFQEAIDIYQLALSYSPKHQSSLKNIALCYYFLGEYNKCLEHLNKLDVIEDEPIKKLQKAAQAQLLMRKNNNVNTAN